MNNPIEAARNLQHLAGMGMAVADIIQGIQDADLNGNGEKDGPEILRRAAAIISHGQAIDAELNAIKALSGEHYEKIRTKLEAVK